MWTDTWMKARYEIRKIKDSRGNEAECICADPSSEIEKYYLIHDGAKVKRGPGKVEFQPKSIKGPDWPPHLALMRLDLNRKEEIEEFCSAYGLLGLRNIPFWMAMEPDGVESRLHKVKYPDLPGRFTNAAANENISELWFSGWYSLPEAAELNVNQLYRFVEPVELFIRAAAEYQKVTARLEKRGPDDPDLIKRYNKMTQTNGRRIEAEELGFAGCIPAPAYGDGKWCWKWMFRSLLEACYFKLFQGYVDGGRGIKRCKWFKCKRPYFAVYATDAYCCIDCRKADTVYHNPDRVLKREVRAKKDAGLITEEERKRLYRFIEQTWKNEKPQLEVFRAMVDDYVGTEKSDQDT